MLHQPGNLFYQDQILKISAAIHHLQHQKNWLGWGRLFSGAGSVVVFFLLLPVQIVPALACGLLVFILFLRLVVLDLRLKEKMTHLQQLLKVNQGEIAIQQHHYDGLETGAHFDPGDHPFANDLDLFGKASLFQHFNRAQTGDGKANFAEWLLQAALPSEANERQTAAKELAPHWEWRQHLQAHTAANPLTQAEARSLEAWMHEKPVFQSGYWTWVVRLFPALSIVVVAGYIFNMWGNSVFYAWLIVAFLFSSILSRRIHLAYLALNKMSRPLEGIQKALKHIESHTFESDWLAQRQVALHTAGSPASKAIKSLYGILYRFDYRYNPLVFLPLNIILLWDLQQMLLLQRWQATHGKSLPKWLEVISDMEAIHSISNCAFNHPEWCFPQLINVPCHLAGFELGHPLIPEGKRVLNDFASEATGHISIITGSNMAGKSTFLRSVGVAAVMAYAGMPVCAASFNIGPLSLISSMRIADNLEENTSTFYAELKKLKTIIEAVQSGNPVFVLLDEILRGTNTNDRHIGSRAFINQLLANDASGIIATHDIALTSMAQEYPESIQNFHFDVQVEGDELYFDYKLKTGICTSLNASILMRKIGIRLDS